MPLTDEQKVALEMAAGFSSLANAITAFCVAQTVLLLSSFTKDSKLVSALARWRPFSTAGAFGLGTSYLLGVILCFVAEFRLRSAAPMLNVVCDAMWMAFALRVCAIVGVSLYYIRVFVETCVEEQYLFKRPIKGLTAKQPWFIRKLDTWVFSARLKQIPSNEKEAPIEPEQNG